MEPTDVKSWRLLIICGQEINVVRAAAVSFFIFEFGVNCFLLLDTDIDKFIQPRGKSQTVYILISLSPVQREEIQSCSRRMVDASESCGAQKQPKEEGAGKYLGEAASQSQEWQPIMLTSPGNRVI